MKIVLFILMVPLAIIASQIVSISVLVRIAIFSFLCYCYRRFE